MISQKLQVAKWPEIDKLASQQTATICLVVSMTKQAMRPIATPMAISYGEAYDGSTTAYEEGGTLGKKYSILAII